MIKVENTYIYNIYPAIKSMRNALKSWDKSDSSNEGFYIFRCREYESFNGCNIGPKDMELAKRLISRGSDERKFLRTIHVNCNITATRALWTEIDTYKIGTVRNSTSTMHSILKQNLKQEDFETEIPEGMLEELNEMITVLRKKDSDRFGITQQKMFSMLKHCLPEGYLMMSNYDSNYESLLNMYKARKNHFFLDWVNIIKWLETLPYFLEFYEGFNKENKNG
jgi:hypothetical protein